MATNPFFSGRIPHALYDAIESYRQQSGESKTHILVKALANYINHPLEEPEPANSSRLETLENRVSQLERWISTIQLQAERPAERLEVIPQGQMSLYDIQPMSEEIAIDNSSDNQDDNSGQPIDISVIANDNEQDNTPSLDDTVVIDEDNKLDNKVAASPDWVRIGKMKTNDVPKLPGLEKLDPSWIKTKLNNTRNTKKQETQIRFYKIVLAKTVSSPARGKKSELFWDIYKNNTSLNEETSDLLT